MQLKTILNSSPKFKKALNKSIQDFSRPLVPDAAGRSGTSGRGIQEGGPGVNIVPRGANEALLRQQYAAILRLI